MPTVTLWRPATLANLNDLAANDATSPVRISHLLGPVLIGVLLNCFVYGLVFLHWLQYTFGRNRDSIYLRGLVHWCFLVDTIHSTAALWLLWAYTVPNFANAENLKNTLWPVTASPLFVALVSAPIQILFAWRIKRFTLSMTIFGVLAALTVATFALGVVTAVAGLLHRQVASSRKLIPLVDAWLGTAMTCDALLAVLLFMHLWKSRTGFRSTDTVIGRLMRSSVETTLSSALFCICYLTLFTALPKTNFHIIFSLPLGRVYTSTLLSTLNSRSTLREELFGISSITGDALGDTFHISEQMRRMPTEVAINVEQEVQSERLEEVDFKQLRRARRKDVKPDSDDVEFTPM